MRRISVFGVFIGVLAIILLNSVSYAFFTALDRKNIENTQQGLLNNNMKIDKVNNELQALSGNIVKLQAQITMQGQITGNLQAGVANQNRALTAMGSIYQNKNNDVTIFYTIIAAMGLIMLIMAGLILYLLQSERMEDKEEKKMFREIVMKGEENG